MEPEDFEVEEVAAYLPSGQGEHLFLWLEKRDVPAFALTAALERALGVPAHEIGVAGMKDARAVTRQWVSVPAHAEAALTQGGKEALLAAHITVLDRKRHDNKLKTGHLRGNIFNVLVRDLSIEGDALDAQIDAWRKQTEQAGVVNVFGAQRFGFGGHTVLLGLGVLRADNVARAPKLSKAKLRLSLSAVQSALFNAFVKERLQRDNLYRVERGDVAMVCASGGPFVVEDADEVNERMARRDVVLSGPLYGPKMRQAAEDALRAESELLTSFGLTPAHFLPFAKLAQGARRACVIWPKDVVIKRQGSKDMRVQFFLPSGSYATELLGQWFDCQLPARTS